MKLYKKVTLSLSLVSAFALSSLSASELIQGGPVPITHQDLKEAQQTWIDGLLAISAAHQEGGDYRALAAEMIDRFGELPFPTQNLVRLIEIKHQAIAANIAKIDVGARGTLVTFHKDDFPDPAGLVAYVDRLQGTAKLRPDMKLVINRAWGDPQSRLNGLFQLTKGLSGIVKKAAKAKAREAA